VRIASRGPEEGTSVKLPDGNLLPKHQNSWYILGKALELLEEGTGVIKVLVTLQ
jgi:hypothetical protein